MAKQTVTFNFAQGLNLKQDPWQIGLGQFLNLQNSIFQQGGLLSKRPGYGLLTNENPNSSYLTTLNSNLLSIGNTVNAYSSSLGEWITKGTLQPCSLNVLPLIRNNLNQTQCDSVVSNGMVLTVYSQINNTTTQYFYVIADAVTGQNIVQPTQIPLLAGGTQPTNAYSSRVFSLNNYFVIISPVLITATRFLQYIAIPIANPSSPLTPQDVTSEVYSSISANPGWDGAVADNTLVIAYNSTSGAQGVHVASLTEAQIASHSTTSTIHTFNNAAYIAAILSICVDVTVSPNIFYISFWNNSTTNGYTCAVFIGLNTITTKFTPQQIITTTVIANLASAAQNNSCLVFSEVVNAYSYDSSIASDFIDAVTVSSTGTVGTPYVAIRSVGLASKAFIINGTVYFLSAYQNVVPTPQSSAFQNNGNFQPTYFLMNGSLTTSAAPIIVAKLAYENGGGYLALGLPSVTITNNVAQIPYLIKDLVEALNTLNNPQQTTAGGIYSQTGINLVSFTLGTTAIDTAEIGQTLQISGGYLSMFDGYLPVEQNFFLWPDNIEGTVGTSGSMTAQQYYYQVTYEWSDNNGNIYRSAPSIPVTFTTGGTGSVTLNIPTLRLTAKTANPVKIVIYRWSAGSQVYQQVTSITAPLLNSTTTDSVTYTDTQSDTAIAGNNIIYTTGGVVEDVNAPSFSICTLFDTRLWIVDAEDPNLLWVSKQVIENTPVEMSDLFTIYIAPNTGTVESTGPITALAPMDDKLIIFKENAIYYINGVGPNNLGTTAVGCSLGNYSQPTFITAIVGCTNQQSIVLTSAGLMFQSDKGIWLLGRDLSTTYIGAPVESFNSSVVTSANSIPETNYVLFTLNTGEMLMHDYYYNQWGTFVGAPAVSSTIYNGLHTILTPFGEILQSTPGVYLDNANPVLMSFTTSWLNLAALQGYERFYDFYVLAKYLSPHFLQCQVAYDYNPSILNSTLINPQNFSSSVPSPFGVPTPFGSPGNKEQWKIHSKVQLCESFQLTLTEVFNPAFNTVAGAGFTMSGISCTVGIKSSRRPIPGKLSAGMG
jgi:hypothetical protein